MSHRLCPHPVLDPCPGSGKADDPAPWRRPLGRFGWVVICPLPAVSAALLGPGRGWEVGDGEPGGAGSPGPPAVPAASLPWEVLAAIDVASVTVCVSLCVPATAAGSPCPPALPHTAQAVPEGWVPSGRPVGTVLPYGRLDARGRAGSAVPASPWPLCRLFVPRDWGRWQRCPPGWPAQLGSRGGSSEWPPAGLPASPCCPHHPSLLSPLPQTGHPPLGLAGKRQRDRPCRGWLQRGRAW